MEYSGEIEYCWSVRRYPAPPRPLLQAFLRRAVELCRLPLEPVWGIELRFVGDRTMIRCNRQYVGHEGSTDVITFSYLDAPESLFPGDVGIEAIINPDAAFRIGGESGYAEEMALYLVHALLHAAGEDDLDELPRRRMRQREQEVLDPLRREFDFHQLFPLRCGGRADSRA